MSAPAFARLAELHSQLAAVYAAMAAEPASVPAEDRAVGLEEAAMLFNADALTPGLPALLVEGAGDVMSWHHYAGVGEHVAVGLLGVALTPTKVALLKTARPSKVVVALDNEPEAQRRALLYVEDLRMQGFDACLGRWEGGKS